MPEEPAKVWAASLQRSIAEYDYIAEFHISLCNCTIKMGETHSQYLRDFLHPLPIISSDCECCPGYVFQDVAMAVNCGDRAIPLVSCGNEEIDGLM